MFISKVYAVLGVFAMAHLVTSAPIAQSGVRINMTCTGELDVYADGVHQTTSDTAGQLSTAVIPLCTTVIAVRCYTPSGIGGITGSLSDGTVTDNTWKCTETQATGWTEARYDDTDWSAAVEVQGFYYSHYDAQDHIASSAKWIWTAGYLAQHDKVYCRRSLAGCPSTTTTTTTTTPEPTTTPPPTTTTETTTPATTKAETTPTTTKGQDTTTNGMSTGYDCTSKNPCTPANVSKDQFFFPHTDTSKYVQCSTHGQCFEQQCPGGLVWNQIVRTCDWPQ